MLRKRVIFTLIYADGYFHQSRNFRLQRVGNLQWLEKNYNFKDVAKYIDELIILDVSRNIKDINSFGEIIYKLKNITFIPIAVGGGIKTLKDAQLLFQLGADKIVINTGLYSNPDAVTEMTLMYGSQSIIGSIDYKKVDNKYVIFIKNGTVVVDTDILDYIKNIKQVGVGEIYLNSIDRDGTGFGFDIEIIEKIGSDINIPIIFAGGAGNEAHLSSALDYGMVSAVATANLYNFVGNGLKIAREKMIESNQNIANWDYNLN